MAHAFDTGLPKPQRTQIRTAIATALAPLLYTPTPTPAGYVRAIVEFAGSVKSEDDVDGLAMLYGLLQGRAPAIAVSLGGKSYEASGSTASADRHRANLTVDIFVASNHQRSHEARAAGDVVSAADDTVDPGFEVMLEHIEELLSGTDLGVGTVYRMIPQREDEVATGEGITIWRQQYQVKTQRDVNPNRTVSQLLLEIQALHSQPDVVEVDPVVDAVAEIDP